MLSNWGGVAPFKASVEGLVNETIRPLYVPHVLQNHTHSYPQYHTFLLISISVSASFSMIFFLQFFLASSSSSAVFSHISFVSSWQLFPPVYYCSFFPLSQPDGQSRGRKKERKGEWQTEEPPVLAGWPVSTLFADGQSQQQLTMQTLS